MRLGFDEPPACLPFWEATRTHSSVQTVECITMRITVTRTYRSTQSMRHAEDEAVRLAKCEAQAAMAQLLRTHVAPEGACLSYGYFDNCR